ncbi:MAG: helix-turn-helix domain-containing protein [Clostridiales Family XIII bacterium]|nr:helix-turn-helix domain-containing protein [Clostridiales Family XIII bacterium]
MASKYKRLTLSERKAIGHSLDQNHSLKQIARDLGLHEFLLLCYVDEQ